MVCPDDFDYKVKDKKKVYCLPINLCNNNYYNDNHKCHTNRRLLTMYTAMGIHPIILHCRTGGKHRVVILINN